MPPKASSPLLKLIHTTTSLRNVTIATPSDEFFYDIVTYKWDPLVTKIRRQEPETGQMSLVAEMKMKYKQSSYTGLRFANQSHDGNADVFYPLETFFHIERGYDGGRILGSFSGNDGKRYRWQEVKGCLELFRVDEVDGKSLARFHSHHRHLGVLRMSQKPYLEVDPELSGILDTVIVSFLLAEGRRRDT